MADVATLVFDIDSSQARTAASDLAKLNDASVRASSGADKLNRTLRDSQGRFRSSASVAKEYGSEVRQLAAKYNPALNAVYQYQQAQVELNRAVALGVLTQAQAETTLAGVASGMRQAALGARTYETGMRGVNNVQASVGNQFAQLNDVVVTAWGGMNPALIGMQQGMQMVQGFAGQSVPQALGTLKGAFAQLLNPTTLLTVGLVAGGAALIQWGASVLMAEEDTRSFEDVLSDLENQISTIRELNKFSGADGISAMGEAYGEVTKEVRELIEARRFLAAEMAKDDLSEAMEKISSDTGTSFWQSWLGDTSGGVGASQAIIDAENRIENLRNTLIITESDAKTLGVAMEAAFNAKTVEDQVATLALVRQYLTIIAQSGREGADAAAKMLEEIIEAEDAARKLLAAAGNLPATFSAAASAASKITDELNRAVNAAYRLANSAISDVRFAQIELDFRTDPIEKAGALAAAKFDEEVGKSGMDQWLYNSLRQQAIDAAKETAVIMGEVDKLNKADREAERGDKSGGAADLKAAQKGFQSLRELLEQDSMFQFAEYEKRQAQLDAALSKKLLSEQNYEEMRKQLQMMYFGTEYQQNAVNYQLDLEQLNMAFEARLLSEQQYLMRRQQLQHEYYSNAISVNQNQTAQQLSNMSADFAQMNQLAGGGYDKLMRAQKTFAAGSALINAYLAASQALADPTVPFWGKFAAFAKVLAAGMGAVNAIKGSGSGSAASTASAATRADPTKNVLINLTGEGWMVDLVEEVLVQAYEQSGNGRVIVQRDYS